MCSRLDDPSQHAVGGVFAPEGRLIEWLAVAMRAHGYPPGYDCDVLAPEYVAAGEQADPGTLSAMLDGLATQERSHPAHGKCIADHGLRSDIHCKCHSNDPCEHFEDDARETGEHGQIWTDQDLEAIERRAASGVLWPEGAVPQDVADALHHAWRDRDYLLERVHELAKVKAWLLEREEERP